jgi:hypothetical protein
MGEQNYMQTAAGPVESRSASRVQWTPPSWGVFLFLPMHFDLDCRTCPRLATFLDEVRVRHPDYHARPVPAFGDPAPDLLIVGLAPGIHASKYRTDPTVKYDSNGLE